MAQPGESPEMKGARFVALGTEFGFTVVAGVILGYYLDDWLGTGPLFLLVGTIGSFFGAVYRMLQMLKRAS